jgi:hypothetical protein
VLCECCLSDNCTYIVCGRKTNSCQRRGVLRSLLFLILKANHKFVTINTQLFLPMSSLLYITNMCTISYNDFKKSTFLTYSWQVRLQNSTATASQCEVSIIHTVPFTWITTSLQSCLLYSIWTCVNFHLVICTYIQSLNNHHSSKQLNTRLLWVTTNGFPAL